MGATMGDSLLWVVLAVPFTGCLVRYRVAYHPKPESIRSRGPSEESHNSNDYAQWKQTRPSFIQIAKDVWRNEGPEGLFKGLGVPLVFGLIDFGFLADPYIVPAPITYRLEPLNALQANFFYYIVLILTYRSIITPHTLFSFRPLKNLPLLFTPRELARPWTILFSRALFTAFFLQVVMRTIVIRGLMGLIWPKYSTEPNTVLDFAVYFSQGLVPLFCVIITAPLDVLVTRLVVQKWDEPVATATTTTTAVEGTTGTSPSDGIPIPGENAAQNVAKTGAGPNQEGKMPSLEVGVAVEVLPAYAEHAKTSQAVDHVLVPPISATPMNTDGSSAPQPPDSPKDVVFKMREQPYASPNLWQCVKTIKEEEGWGALYRMWFITYLSTIVSC